MPTQHTTFITLLAKLIKGNISERIDHFPDVAGASFFKGTAWLTPFKITNGG